MEIIKMIVYLFSLLSGCYGYFSWGHVEYDCDGTITMHCDYATDEIVTRIRWYKQPGNIIIAEKRGLSIPFRVSRDYKGRLTEYAEHNETTQQNDAIQITGFTEADDGLYSCNITKHTTDSPFTNQTGQTIQIWYRKRCPKPTPEPTSKPTPKPAVVIVIGDFSGKGTRVSAAGLFVIVSFVLVTSCILRP